MRYQFINPGDREAILKKYYHRILVFTSVGIVALIIFLLSFRGFVHQHGMLVILAFTVCFVAFALIDRSSRRNDGVSDKEFQEYFYRRPIIRILQLCFVITVVVKAILFFLDK